MISTATAMNTRLIVRCCALLSVVACRPNADRPPAESALVASSADVGNGSSCRPPRSSVPRAVSEAMISRLGGHSYLTMVAGTEASPVRVSGALELEASSTAAHDTSAVVFPLSGYTLVPLEKLGQLSLAYPASSRSDLHPGVQAVYNRRASQLSLIFGNAFTPQGTTTDAGIILDVYAFEDGRILGQWRDGGRLRTPMNGFFCIARR